MSRSFADRQADGAALRLFDGAGPGRSRATASHSSHV